MSDIDDLFNELEAVQPDPELLEDPQYADLLKAETVQEDPRPLPPAPPVVIMPPALEERQKVEPALVSDLANTPSPPPPAKVDVNSLANVIDIEKFLDTFEKDYQAINVDLIRDRAKADKLALTFIERVENGTADKAETESLVKLMDTIVNSNGHRVKLLSERAKCLSVLKSSITTLIQNNIDASGGNDDEALVDLLTNTEEYEA